MLSGSRGISKGSKCVGTEEERAVSVNVADPASLKRSKRIDLAQDQVWELLVDRDLQSRWLGPKARVSATRGSRARLGDDLGVWREGVTTDFTDGVSVNWRLLPRPTWPAQQMSTDATISLEVDPKGGTRVAVVETGFNTSETGSDAPEADAGVFWEAALVRLSRLATAIKNRRERPRQAIMIVHGIGEQEPGSTLEQFVQGVIQTSPNEIETWTRPDQLSGSFELRRITLKASAGQLRPTTDIFELYWAHLTRDTTLSQVASWAQGLLLRWPVPKPFRTVWVLFWALVLGVFTATLGYLLGLWDFGRLIPFFAVVGLFVTWAWRLAGKGAVIDSLGDAARYLTPRPSNIQNRQAIRIAAVDLLDALHQSAEYDRVIVVGHSLGSVIAYDAITYYWIRVHQSHLRVSRPVFGPLRELERNIDLTDVDEAQRLQFQAWKTSRANSQPWLVSDLITLGSPLAHGDFLMARGSDQFAEAKADRKLPTCPPVIEVEKKTRFRRVSFETPYTDRIGGKVKDKTFTVLHHAAPFGITRWTNLYFPSRLLGDPVGGKVADQFGLWVKDVSLTPPKRGFVHTYYWRPGKNGNGHLDVLRDTLQLDSGRDLLAVLGRQRPISLVYD